LLVALILVFTQVLSLRHDLKLDTTVNRRFSLSPQTKSVLAEIDDEIMITCFYKDASEEKVSLKDLLSSYRDQSRKIEYRFVDPDRDPIMARRYDVRSFGVSVVESDRGREKLTAVSESDLTNAIYRVINRERARIYFTTGHGEKDISSGAEDGFSALAEKLGSENYSPKELTLAENRSVPADCSVLIIAGPMSDLLPAEKTEVVKYLENGGSALFLLDPIAPVDGLADIALKYGISVGNDVIVDRSGILAAGNYLTPVVNRYGDHRITRDFKYFSFFPQARSVSMAEGEEASSGVTELSFTNKSAYAETDISLILEGKTRFDRVADRQGPIPLAAVYSSDARDDRLQVGEASEVSRVAVFGDSDFASNSVIDLYGNKDLIMNAVNWLSTEEELISVRARSALVQPVLLTRTQGRLVFWLSTIVVPTLVALIGVIRLSRKKRISERGGIR
jgi:ABC-type uncharacterized transport system involved in gliding motility auxiliary subunit